MDQKFSGTIIKNKDGSVVPPDQWIVFLVKDNAFADILPLYRNSCQMLGADQAQLNAVDALIERVEEWRRVHPDLCKVPDVQPGELRS